MGLYIEYLIIIIVVPLVIIAGIVWLQIYLSSMNSRWPGFILPGISFALSVMLVLAMVMFTSSTITSTHYAVGPTAPNIVHHLTDMGIIRVPLSGSIGAVIFTFFLANIPTVILIIVYAICRDKRRKQAEINRMSVQDLG